MPAAKAVYQKHGIDDSPSANVPAGKIAVISPEGTPGFIDADKWSAAEKRGFKRQ
jgi:hypothetical protein